MSGKNTTIETVQLFRFKRKDSRKYIVWRTIPDYLPME
jgi:hypothetical protein